MSNLTLEQLPVKEPDFFSVYSAYPKTEQFLEGAPSVEVVLDILARRTAAEELRYGIASYRKASDADLGDLRERIDKYRGLALGYIVCKPELSKKFNDTVSEVYSGFLRPRTEIS